MGMSDGDLVKLYSGRILELAADIRRSVGAFGLANETLLGAS